MKKTLFAVFITTALLTKSTTAQTLQEGINHLFADRFTNAVNTFQKILAVNPNVIDATYWLGQTYLDMDDNDAARQLYDKALLANGNAPLLMVGKGHVLLIDKKPDEARQMFESALTISRTKKGDDPLILNAIGAANVDAKQGNLTYAIEKLELAMQRDPKNAEIALNLGNAYRKANPGSGGSKAYEMYKLATQLNPNFAYPYVRIAKLFETQKNWELVLENLNKAIQIDPNFSLAYYELFYYYFYNLKYDEATTIFNKYVASRAGEGKTEDDYLNSQLCWAKKDYDCAISKAESVKIAMGAKVKPKVYKQLAYSYLGKSDFANAKTNVDAFFEKEKDGLLLQDYILKVDIYSGAGVPCDKLYGLYLDGAAADSVLQSKIDYMNKAADFFKSKNCKKQEADMRFMVYNTRKNPNPGGLFNLGLNYMQAGELAKADSLFKAYNTAFPDSIYGYSWRGRVNYTLDTTMTVEPFISNLLENYQKSLSIAATDPVRFKSHGITAARTLAAYYVNIKSNHDTALVFVYKGLEIDSTDASLKSIRDVLEKQQQTPAQKPNQPKTPVKNNTKAAASLINKSPANSLIAKK
jgi:tetratricopeptide (TPR) repeat protein